MYVCVCNAVTEEEVEIAIDQGARTRTQITHACGAGGDCGSCHRMIDDRLDARGYGPDRQVPLACEPLLAEARLVRERAA